MPNNGGGGTPQKRPRTVGEFNKQVQGDEIPQTPPKKRKPKDKRYRYITQTVLKQSLTARNRIAQSLVINNAVCEMYRIEYVTEAIAQIIVAKNIKRINIPTPFGECVLQCLSTNNYIARVTFNPPKYQVLLDVIDRFGNKDALIKGIQGFLSYEIDDRFDIDTTKDVSENIKSTLNKYITCASIPDLKKHITYPRGYKGIQTKITYKNVGAIMCGIFIAEMIRSAGKIVRAAFRDWPKTLAGLKEKFIQADVEGCKQFRAYILGDAGDLEAGKLNVKNMSPFKKLPNKK